MKLILILLITITSIFFIACGEDDVTDLCTNKCETHAETRCHATKDNVLETCTNTAVCQQWVEVKCSGATPICKEEDDTPASCTPDI